MNEIVNNNDLETDNLEVINWDTLTQTWITSLNESESTNNSVTTDLVENFGSLGLWSNNTTSVSDLPSDISFNLWPNPTQEQLNIEISSNDADRLQLFIFSELGELVSINKARIQSGDNSISIEIGSIHTGAYQLFLKGETLNFSTRFVKI